MSFWSFEGGQWTQREDVAPPLALRDFWDESKPVPGGKYGVVELEYELPRVVPQRA